MKVSLLGVALLALSSAIAFAQTAPAETSTKPAIAAHNNAGPMHRRVNINKRRVLQQKRIAKGIATGKINARKGAKLERTEASIARQEHRMRAANNGRLTRANRVKLNHRLNRTSRAIYRTRRSTAIKPAVVNQ